MRAIKTRNRGVLFDPLKVRHFAQKQDIKSFSRFEINALRKYPNELNGSKSMYKAWYGKGKVEPRLATLIANTLELEDYIPLILDASRPVTKSWEALINNRLYRRPFMRFHYQSKLERNLIHFNAADPGKLDQIPLSATWHLSLEGEKHEQVFILIRSQTHFFQIAPVPFDGFSNAFKGDNLLYPNNNQLEFDASKGKGWRQIIAIKARQLPCTGKTPTTGFSCSIDELNVFAYALQQFPANSIAIDTYSFELV